MVLDGEVFHAERDHRAYAEGHQIRAEHVELASQKGGLRPSDSSKDGASVKRRQKISSDTPPSSLGSCAIVTESEAFGGQIICHIAACEYF